MRFIRREETVRGVGRPDSKLYAEGVDMVRYDDLVKSFVCRFYREEKHDYHFPYNDGAQMDLSRAEFLSMLYAVLIEQGVLVDCQNIRPYLNHLLVVLGDGKYLVHYTGMSRIVHDIKRITPYYNSTLEETPSRATLQRIHTYADAYTYFKKRWNQHLES